MGGTVGCGVEFGGRLFWRPVVDAEKSTPTAAAFCAAADQHAAAVNRFAGGRSLGCAAGDRSTFASHSTDEPWFLAEPDAAHHAAAHPLTLGGRSPYDSDS